MKSGDRKPKSTKYIKNNIGKMACLEIVGESKTFHNATATWKYLAVLLDSPLINDFVFMNGT